MQTVKRKKNKSLNPIWIYIKSWIDSNHLIMKSKFISSNHKSPINCYNKQIEKPFFSLMVAEMIPLWSITLNRTCFFLSGFQFRRSFFIRSCRNKYRGSYMSSPSLHLYMFAVRYRERETYWTQLFCNLIVWDFELIMDALCCTCQFKQTLYLYNIQVQLKFLKIKKKTSSEHTKNPTACLICLSSSQDEPAYYQRKVRDIVFMYKINWRQ